MFSFNKKLLFATALLFIFLAVIGVLSLDTKPQNTWEQALREHLGAPEYENVDPSRAIKTQTSRFEIAGRTFVMPKVFIQTNLSPDRESTGVNLIYVLPDYKSRADFNDSQEYENARRAKQFGHMLIQPASKYPSFDKILENRRTTISKEEHIETTKGLDHFRWYRERPEGVVPYYDIFLEVTNDGSVASFIECRSASKNIISPGCKHYFSNQGILFISYYNKDNYLMDWREMRSSAIRFINSFETHN